MKVFHKKKTAGKQATPQRAAPDSEQSFYARPAGEEPIDGSASGFSGPTTRTSRHTPAHPRERCNRTSNRDLFFLLFRAGLIVVLLGGGYLALKIAMDRLAEPSEKEKQHWEATAALMEKGDSNEVAAPGLGRISNEAQIQERLRAWDAAERHMRSAESLYHRGLAREAVERLEKVLRSAPDSYAAQKLLLEICMADERYEEAVSLSLRLLDQDSRQWEIKMDLLKALQRLNRTPACLLLANRMLEKEPDNMRVLEVTAGAQWTAGDLDAALSLFARMLKNEKRHQGALEGAALIHQAREDWANATACYLDLVGIAPQEDYYQALAHCYARQGEAGRAILSMGQAASLFGEPAVSSWLRQDLEQFDPIRETVEYRAFADRLVGIKTRKAIEELRLREVQEEESEMPATVELPTRPDLKILRPDGQ